MGEQLSFDWQAAPKPRMSKYLETPTTFLPGVDGPVIRPTRMPHAVKRYLRDVVERYFRERGIPFVCVDEAKKALFASAKLSAFHFVSYNKTGPNWLIWAAQMRSGVREDMMEWAKVFGEGFLAVVAKESSSGELSFATLNSDKVEIG